MLGLTKRSFEKSLPADVEVQQLKIPFSRHKFSKLNGSVLGKSLDHKAKDIIFNNGVIYTSGTNKGDALDMFVKKTNHKFNKIVMVDDKVNNLEAVYKYALKHGIEMIGYQINLADNYKK